MRRQHEQWVGVLAEVLDNPAKIVNPPSRNLLFPRGKFRAMHCRGQQQRNQNCEESHS
jgi:hypothetical protein